MINNNIKSIILFDGKNHCNQITFYKGKVFYRRPFVSNTPNPICIFEITNFETIVFRKHHSFS